ncbi:hypothetical protein ABEB36_012579 [Hypothenemus hampei]|uniref:Uncharacterized protein n=1 Tax=Hypothenemus hampei TaxID=57062 RepID=A0ABD1EBP8_HYPHA
MKRKKSYKQGTDKNGGKIRSKKRQICQSRWELKIAHDRHISSQEYMCSKTIELLGNIETDIATLRSDIGKEIGSIVKEELDKKEKLKKYLLKHRLQFLQKLWH